MRRKTMPFEACREKVGEAGLFLDSFHQGGFEQRKRTRRRAAKKVKRRNSEQLKGDHGGDGIPRQAEDPGLAAAPEDGGFSRANGNRVKEKLSAKALENGFDEVVLSHRDTARKDKNIFLEAEFDFRGEIIDAIEGVAQGNGFGAGEAHLRGKRDAVAVADMKGSGSFRDRDKFIAGGKNGYVGLFCAQQVGRADLRCDREFGETEARAGLQGELSSAGFTAARHDILSGFGGTVESDGLAVALGKLDHYDGIGSWRHRGAGHDLNAGARDKRRSYRVSRLDFCDAAEIGPRARFARTNGVAITR